MASPAVVHQSSLVVKVGRALLLRCPRCGAPGILHRWTKMSERCPTCGLALERGESHDFWLGAYAINLVIAEGTAAVIAFIILWKTWPGTRLSQSAAIALAVVMPWLFYPFS